jgi:ribosome-binding protein aMBF1 (putative translation factor)
MFGKFDGMKCQFCGKLINTAIVDVHKSTLNVACPSCRKIVRSVCVHRIVEAMFEMNGSNIRDVHIAAVAAENIKQ